MRHSGLVLMTLLLALSASACKKGGSNDPCAVDADSDGYNACNDCADDDAAINPGAAEACGNTVDDNCDGSTDEGCGDCNPNLGDTLDCGVTGSGCSQACLADFTWGTCLPADGSTPDLQTDVNHCGECGQVCATPTNAAAVCAAGTCGRGPCAKGFFDLEGGSAGGCHWSCAGTLCTRDSGETVTLSAPPLPETGNTVAALASGSSFGGAVQTSAGYTNFGILGEGSIAAPDAPVQSSATWRHQGGLTSARP